MSRACPDARAQSAPLVSMKKTFGNREMVDKRKYPHTDLIEGFGPAEAYAPISRVWRVS
jgi:hypothetical protein